MNDLERFGNMNMAKILLIGDDIAAIDLMAASAEGLGYETVVIYESVDALETAIQEEPALVILEEKMEIFHGFEVSTQLRGDPDVPNDLPILMMTSNNVKPQDLEKAGITDTILPEIDPALLREKLVALTGE